MTYSVKSLITNGDSNPHAEDNMSRLEAIYHSERWLKCMKEIESAEVDRIYCKHDFVHLMDVARLAYIYSLEEDLHIDKDVIYAASLLHDIGRSREYNDGIPHDDAGADIARDILSSSYYSEDEREAIISAIRGHRGHDVVEDANGMTSMLTQVIKRADKESRLCLVCEARESCKWPDEKKNLSIKY